MDGRGAGERKYDHHRLDVYNAVVQFVAWRTRALRRVPPGCNLREQLIRASDSIGLNISEGSGEYSGPERRRFYRIAKRSATECDGALDLLVASEQLTPAAACEGRLILDRILAMLTVMVRPPARGR